METEEEPKYNPNHWHDLLLKSIEDDIKSGKIDEDIAAIFGESFKKPVSEKSNFIKLSNPDKLSKDYALLDGNSVRIKYMTTADKFYHYNYKIRTKPNVAGEMHIFKEKLDGRVYIEFHHDNGGSESRIYEMDEFSNFDTFMNLIVDVIRKF